MAVIKVRGFAGLAPKTDPQYLKPNQSQEAENCKLTSGALQAWRNSAQTAALVLDGEVQSIYRLDGKWMQWNADVDVEPSPLAGDTTDRTYFSGLYPGMRVTDNSLIDAGVVTGSITAINNGNPIKVTSAKHGLYTGAKVYIESVGGITEINDRWFTITYDTEDTFFLNNENGGSYGTYTSGGTWTRRDNEYPEQSYLAGVPTPTTAPTASLSGSHSSPSNTAYVYTFVNEWGEESAPSPASNIVAADFSTGSVDLTGMDQTWVGHYQNITKWRIYRVSISVTDAEYLFVAEVTINGSSPQYNDSVADGDLGEAIITTDWAPPDENMTGITSMANGIMAGFYKNEVMFCEPYLPYAWPQKYNITLPYDVVAMRSFGSTLVVTTTSNPYLITGLAPETMSVTKVPHRQPCISKRSIASMGDGVIYACPDGLFFIGQSGTKLVTDQLYTRQEWQSLTPEFSVGEQYDGKYVIFFADSDTGLVFDPLVDGPTELAFDAAGLYVDQEEDKLYMTIFDDTQNLTNVKAFNSGGSRLVYTWRSKVFKLPAKMKFTAARVYATFDAALPQDEIDAIEDERTYLIGLNDAIIAAGNVNGAINTHEVNDVVVNGDELYVLPNVPDQVEYVLKVYADGELIHNVTVNGNSPLRLPADERYSEYEVELSGTFPVQSVTLATSVRELIKNGP